MVLQDRCNMLLVDRQFAQDLYLYLFKKKIYIYISNISIMIHYDPLYCANSCHQLVHQSEEPSLRTTDQSSSENIHHCYSSQTNPFSTHLKYHSFTIIHHHCTTSYSLTLHRASLSIHWQSTGNPLAIH